MGNSSLTVGFKIVINFEVVISVWYDQTSGFYLGPGDGKPSFCDIIDVILMEKINNPSPRPRAECQ
jgi:hypothetical protein